MLLKFCQQQNIDRKEFRRLHDIWAKQWARQSYEAQGFITEEINRRLR
jgi:hypothetical protein